MRSMTRRNLGGLAGLALVGLLATPALAQPMGRGGGCGHGGWGRDGAYLRNYDATKVQTLSGTVVAIQRVAPVQGLSQGVHLVLQTDKEKVEVHLGPAWYLDHQEPQIAVNDRLEVIGSRVVVQGKSVLIASEVRKGEHTLTLRDGEGYPLWCGWRRR